MRNHRHKGDMRKPNSNPSPLGLVAFIYPKYQRSGFAPSMNLDLNHKRHNWLKHVSVTVFVFQNRDIFFLSTDNTYMMQASQHPWVEAGSFPQ